MWLRAWSRSPKTRVIRWCARARCANALMPTRDLRILVHGRSRATRRWKCMGGGGPLRMARAKMMSARQIGKQASFRIATMVRVFIFLLWLAAAHAYAQHAAMVTDL